MVLVYAIGEERSFLCAFAVGRNCTNFRLDISGRNVAFTYNKGLNSPGQEPFDILSSPKVEPLACNNSTPLDNGLPTVKAGEWVDWIDEDEEDIRLLDIGESFP